jgi:hypothetical protein
MTSHGNEISVREETSPATALAAVAWVGHVADGEGHHPAGRHPRSLWRLLGGCQHGRVPPPPPPFATGYEFDFCCRDG